MENLQDSKIISEQRKMIDSGTQFRERALCKISSSGGGVFSGISADSEASEPDGGNFDSGGGTQNPKLRSQISHAFTGHILRIVSTLLLCALSLSFYSAAVASQLREFLSDGVSAVLMRDLFSLSSASSDGGGNSANINHSILNILGTALQKPVTSIMSPYYPSSKSDSPGADTSPGESGADESLSEGGISESGSGADVSSGFYPIVISDLSTKAENGLTFHNETTYSPDAEALLASAVPIPSLNEIYQKYGSGAPVVLILHTHGTEAYSPENSTEYSETENFRSEDTSRNVVSVGAVMAETLNQRGINTIHCTTMHDKDSYRDSYNRSLETIKAFLDQYPSIQYIFDVHRDSVISSDMKCIRPVTTIDGTEAAQFMTVVGTDFKGADHPYWEENNLTLAVHLQTSLAQKYPGFVRSINLRAAGFNAQYAPGSLLLEIGTCGNTLSQAKKTAETVASAIADIISSTPDSGGKYFS